MPRCSATPACRLAHKYNPLSHEVELRLHISHACPSSAGCTDPTAVNFDETATVSDGSCTYPGVLAIVSPLFLMLGVTLRLPGLLPLCACRRGSTRGSDRSGGHHLCRRRHDHHSRGHDEERHCRSRGHHCCAGTLARCLCVYVCVSACPRCTTSCTARNS